MPVVSVGDMAQQFISMRNGSTIKQELGRLAESLSTGQVTDVTRHLNGETARFSGVSYSLTQIDGYMQAASETQQMLVGMQTVLSRVDALRAETGAQLLLVSDASSGSQIDEAALAAKGTFETMVSALNTRLADRSLFGGVDVASTPLADADAMLADIRASIPPGATLADITTAIETWFDDPLGGFATMGYQGDNGLPPVKRVSETKSYAIDARADDPAIRNVLKAATFAAVANDLPGLDTEMRLGLLQEAGTRMFAAGAGLVAVQSRIGYVEAGVEQASTELTAQRTALEISRNNLISADPFDTASRLQAVQLQLETHYSVTARMSQLSLVRYL